MLNSLLCAVVLAVREARELDAAAHVARIYSGGRKLVHARCLAFDERASDQRHPAANHVHRNDIEALFGIGRQLAEIGPQQIGERAGGIYTLVPAAERAGGRTLYDAG